MSPCLKRAAVVLVGSAFSVACSGFRTCDGLGRTDDSPRLLSETQLYTSIVADEISPNAIAFEPQFPLWTDGASKRRWLFLPEFSQIDTSDSESWDFPEGTTLFKEFTRDGVRVETRRLTRLDDGWSAVAYIWDGDDAVLAPNGKVDAVGTEHDVPSASDCLACHGGRKSFVLGFSAVQLDPGERARLFAEGLLSHENPGDVEVSPEDRGALGYLHANCSHCHNLDRNDSEVGCYDSGEKFDFTLPSRLEDRQNAPALMTGKDVLGKGEKSPALRRMEKRNQSNAFPSMPPLGTEEVDDDGVELLRQFLLRIE